MDKEKNTFLKWIDNIWYHYKPHIIIGFFALVVLVVGVAQSIGKKEPDVFIYYVGEGLVTVEAAEKFKDFASENFTTDYNGDGTNVVDYKEDVFVMYSADSEVEFNTYVYNSTDQLNIVKRFNMELGMGECVIYIMEPGLYMANTDFFASFEDCIGYMPEFCLEDGKGVKLSDIPAYTQTPLANYPGHYIMCIRSKRDGLKKGFYENNVSFVKSLLEY